MKRIVAICMLCMVLGVAALALAEQVDCFTVTPGKVTKNGDAYVIRLYADFDSRADADSYDGFLVPWDEDGEEYAPDDFEVYANSWARLRNACFVSFKTPDGQLFSDLDRDSEFRMTDAKKQADGTWRRELRLQTYTAFVDVEGVQVALYLFDGVTPFNGEPQAEVFIAF